MMQGGKASRLPPLAFEITEDIFKLWTGCQDLFPAPNPSRGTTLNLDDAVVLETFSNRIEAEMAAGILEAEGIEAMVMADDAGGTYPMLQFIRGVKLMVAAADEARAKEILAAMAEAGDLVVEP
jgi:hypothetical protein